MTCYELKQLEDALDTALGKRKDSKYGRHVVVYSEDERWRIDYNARKATGAEECSPCKPMSCIWWKWHECPGKEMQQDALPKHLQWRVPCVELQALACLVRDAIDCRERGYKRFSTANDATGWSIQYWENRRIGLVGQVSVCHAKECPWHRVKLCEGKSTAKLINERAQWLREMKGE